MAIRPVVYVAGSLSGPALVKSWRLANDCAARLARAGLVPLVPHNMVMLEFASPDLGYEDFMDMCLALLAKCDALLRMPGESPGGDREVAYARSLGVPVFFDETALTALRR